MAVGGAEHQDVGAVGQGHARPAPRRAAPARAGRQHQPGVGRTGLAHRGGEVVAPGRPRRRRACGPAPWPPGRACRSPPPGRRPRPRPRRPSGPDPRPRCRGARSGSRRSAPPKPSTAGRRRPPAVEELVGDRGRPRNSAMTGSPGLSSPTTTAAAPSPPADSSAGGGQAVTHVGQHDQRGAGAGGPRLAPGPGARAERPAEVEGGHLAGQAQGGMDGGGVGLVQVGRGGGGEPDAVRGRRRGRPRAPAGPPRRPWWWCPRHGRPRTGCPCRRRLPKTWATDAAAAAGRGHTRRC